MKVEKEWKLSNSFWRLPFFWYTIRQINYKKRKENYKPIYFMNTYSKILNKISANWIQQDIKRMIQHEFPGAWPPNPQTDPVHSNVCAEKNFWWLFSRFIRPPCVSYCSIFSIIQFKKYIKVHQKILWTFCAWEIWELT